MHIAQPHGLNGLQVKEVQADGEAVLQNSDGSVLSGTATLARFIARTASASRLYGDDAWSQCHVDEVLQSVTQLPPNQAVDELNRLLAYRTFLAGYFVTIADLVCYELCTDRTVVQGWPYLSRWLGYLDTLLPGKSSQTAPAKAAPEQQQKIKSNAAKAAASAEVEEKPLGDLVDVDANFLHERFRDKCVLSGLLETARGVGVKQFVTPVCVLSDCVAGVQLAADHPGCIFVSAGDHPWWTAAEVGGAPREGGVDFSTAALEQLRGWVQHDAVRCVGECGLDLCRGPAEKNGFPPLEAQLPWFEAQVRLAVEFQKPLFLHVRDAFDPFMAVMERHRGELPPMLVHVFTGSEEELIAYRGLDCYVGITGYICDVKQSADHRKFLPKHVPVAAGCQDKKTKRNI